MMGCMQSAATASAAAAHTAIMHYAHAARSQHSSCHCVVPEKLDDARRMTLQVRAAAEAALETLSVCETCSQVGIHQPPARTATPAHYLLVCRLLASTASA